MNWNFSDDKPIFLQIIEEITKGIVSGKYIPGEKLPTVREFAMQASVNPNTMQRALTEIEQNGLISTRRGDGRYVTSDAELIKQMGRERLTVAAKDFTVSMLELGFSEQEISEAIKKELREGK